MPPINRNIKESEIEKYFCEQVELRLNAETRKYKSRRNDPDRLILFKGGTVAFVELKRPGKTAREGQEREHNRLRDKGFDVEVVDTKALVDDWVNRHLPDTKNACPKCGKGMLLLRSMNKKVCCDVELEWTLKENQKPLICCQR